ncbi:hypothetical protein EH183_41940 [Streptomyces sp. CB01881]|uniref:hypothetical protein n=1 Tax=Streptomyces sp. CB01881 TaxID=2078691 RepID=UPI0011DFCC50|nr:hypothetical protein [Streptomyces sp. CB01881]TYC66557.1 hypothetical protein EH183_41940 [Streptomyces sp. CB01881]
MLNPLDAPAAVEAAAEPLEDLLDDINHVVSVQLYPVVAVAASGRDDIGKLAQAVLDAGYWRDQFASVLSVLEPARSWREVVHRAATESGLMPWYQFVERTPDQIRHAGELAYGIADLIESHLGPVRTAAEVAIILANPGALWTRQLLLVSDEWATVLHLRVDH